MCYQMTKRKRRLKNTVIKHNNYTNFTYKGDFVYVGQNILKQDGDKIGFSSKE